MLKVQENIIKCLNNQFSSKSVYQRNAINILPLDYNRLIRFDHKKSIKYFELHVFQRQRSQKYSNSSRQQYTRFYYHCYYLMDQDLQLYKIVLIGNSGTGKTNISSRFMKGVFTDAKQASVGVQFFSKNMSIKGKDVRVTLWDTAGQQRFMSIGKVYYKGARGILAIYDITQPQSYVDIQSWLRLANETVNLSDITVFVVGNKVDLQKDRKVPYERVVKEYKQQFDVDCWEVSAKYGDKIQEMFSSMLQKIYQKSIQAKSSIFYGESQVAAYSQIDRDSSSFLKRPNHLPRQMQPIGQVILQEQQQSQNFHQRKNQLEIQSRMTLTNYEELIRIQESKKKKRCCH